MKKYPQQPLLRMKHPYRKNLLKYSWRWCDRPPHNTSQRNLGSFSIAKTVKQFTNTTNTRKVEYVPSFCIAEYFLCLFLLSTCRMMTSHHSISVACVMIENTGETVKLVSNSQFLNTSHSEIVWLHVCVSGLIFLVMSLSISVCQYIYKVFVTMVICVCL